MRIIRRKDNPLVIKSSGYVGPGGLGPFDSSVYEEVEVAALPNGWIQESIESKESQVKQARAGMLAMYKNASVELRSMFSDVITKINALLDLEDFELALFFAQAVDVSAVPEGPLRDEAADLKDNFIAGLQALAMIG